MPARPLTLVLLAGLALVAAVGSVAVAQGRLLLHGCLPVDAFGTFGLRFALLQDVADCPAGTYGLGAAPRGAVVLLSVALPILALHLVLAACGLGLLAVVRRGLQAIAQVLRVVTRRVRVALPELVVREARLLLPAPVVHRVRARAGLLTWSHRGPPALV
ncbi:hypothetical protein CSO01_24380 [Cellulomonas soli]|uniref:Uncharacterized protein n=1 Tax=Cellulomonas soli TaxID=931535 RepID=A0A512PEX0_9CELL|nr:hypothetical protein CSO01_24380 [Cellulomonas soli]